VLISENPKEEFINVVKTSIESLYGAEGPGPQSTSSARMVNANHYRRVKNLMEEVILNGADLVTGGKMDGSQNYIDPTLLGNVNADHAIMSEEIFGPLIQAITYRSLTDAVEYVNQGERPLALYVLVKT
jgi:aldehyde dehydrogenase (NAD+)